jgi:hypothetical protein
MADSRRSHYRHSLTGPISRRCGEIPLMKTLFAILATASIVSTCGMIQPVFAFGLRCGQPTVKVWGPPDPDPVVSTDITLDGDVWHVTQNTWYRRSWDRSAQYNTDTHEIARSDNVREWRGSYYANPNQWMDGMLWNANGRLWYEEKIFDRGQQGTDSKGKLISDTAQDCGPAIALPKPPIVASLPTGQGDFPINRGQAGPATGTYPGTTNPANEGRGNEGYVQPPSSNNIVPLIFSGNALYAKVRLGARVVTMHVDTGASIMSVSPEVARQLIADGDAYYTNKQTEIEISGGATHIASVLNIKRVTIGGRTVYDVEAVADGSMLLDLASLSSLGFTIDLQNRRLVFNQ